MSVKFQPQDLEDIAGTQTDPVQEKVGLQELLMQRVSQNQEPKKTSAAEAEVVEAGKGKERLDREAVATPTAAHRKAKGGSSGTGT